MVYRVFVSHPIASAALANRVVRALEVLPTLRGFVATEDLYVGRPWFEALTDQLMSCNALVAFIAPGFRESTWCDQEVGYVLGRGKKVLPVEFSRVPIAPHGFLGRYQAINGYEKSDRHLADRIFDALYADESERPELIASVLEALRVGRDPGRLRLWAGRLLIAGPGLNGDQRANVDQILRLNPLVRTDPNLYATIRRALADGEPR